MNEIVNSFLKKQVKEHGNPLSTLSLDELANRFEDIEQQGQLLQGRILLEARNRFKSDKEFGQWCSQSICLGSQPQRTRLMNLARFFEGREMEKIGLSAAYEISAPINADIAVDVYEYAKDKNLPLAEIRKQIAIRKGESLSIPMNEIEIITTDLVNAPTEVIQKSKQDLIMDILEGLSSGEAKKLLRDCMHLIKW